MIGRGLLAALTARLRRQAARMATFAAGFGLVMIGAIFMTIGAMVALVQQFGPIAAFCGSGAVLIVGGLLAAQAMRTKAAAVPKAAMPAAAPPPPQSAQVPVAAVVFVLGFVAIRALLRAKSGGQD